MAEDISVSRLDVVKAYNSKLKVFRATSVACGAAVNLQINKVQASIEEKRNPVKAKLNNAKSHQDKLVKRYKDARANSLPGIEVIGDSDHQIQIKYQAMEAAVNECVHIIDSIKAKMAEIGQETKTFCTILDSETTGSTRKLENMIAHMDEMCNLNL